MRESRWLILLVVIIGLLSYQHWNKIERHTAGSSGPTLDTSHHVVMYSTSWCPYCQKARAFFDQHNISYTEYDIEESSEAESRYRKLGGRGVPLILVGTEKIMGWSPRAVKDALARLEDSSPAPPARDADQEMFIISREDTQEEREKGRYIISLRNGRKITVEDYWERGDKIQYRRLGGITGIERKQVVMIESQVGGTKTWYSLIKRQIDGLSSLRQSPAFPSLGKSHD